jgi:hypothetical protein
MRKIGDDRSRARNPFLPGELDRFISDRARVREISDSRADEYLNTTDLTHYCLCTTRHKNISPTNVIVGFTPDKISLGNHKTEGWVNPKNQF